MEIVWFSCTLAYTELEQYRFPVVETECLAVHWMYTKFPAVRTPCLGWNYSEFLVVEIGGLTVLFTCNSFPGVVLFVYVGTVTCFLWWRLCAYLCIGPEGSFQWWNCLCMLELVQTSCGGDCELSCTLDFYRVEPVQVFLS